jgi:hypothetical protein
MPSLAIMVVTMKEDDANEREVEVANITFSLLACHDECCLRNTLACAFFDMANNNLGVAD